MNTLRLFFCTLIVSILFFILLLVFSPYGKQIGFDQKVLVQKVDINAPVEQVYNYLGNSDHAKDWSSFVHHISLLNQSDHQDGTVGSIRRCFKNKNERGITWDEKTLINIFNKKRRLNIFNINGLLVTSDHLLTEQIYHSIGSDRCQLSFTLFLETEKSTWLDEVKMYAASYFIAPIFKTNLENIKRINENSKH